MPLRTLAATHTRRVLPVHTLWTCCALAVTGLLPACNDDCPEGTHLEDGRCIPAETHDCQLDGTCDAGQGGATPDGSMAGQGGSGMGGSGGRDAGAGAGTEDAAACGLSDQDDGICELTGHVCTVPCSSSRDYKRNHACNTTAQPNCCDLRAMPCRTHPSAWSYVHPCTSGRVTRVGAHIPRC